MPKIWVQGTTPSHKVACEVLRESGFQLTETPSQEIQGVFLDIPSFRSSVFTPTELLHLLPNGAAVIGGGLSSLIGLGHPLLDLLEDADFTAQNADITARCAIRLASDQLDITFRNLPVLILGWGRIGKILARLLQALDAKVWVYARKEADRAMLRALLAEVYCAPFPLIAGIHPSQTDGAQAPGTMQQTHAFSPGDTWAM